MKKIINLSVFSLFAVLGFGQTYFNGNWYEPMPTPKANLQQLHSKVDPNFTNQFVRYDPVNQIETLVNNNITSEKIESASTPGYHIDLHLAEDEVEDNREFTDPYYYGSINDYPQCTSVKLFINFIGNSYVASGVMIGERYVLTAGHCVYSGNDGGWPVSITVVPSYENGGSAYGAYDAVSYLSWTGWTINADFNFDLGLIVLSECAGYSTGWLGFGYDNDNNFFYETLMRNFSYPAESPFTGQIMQYRYGYFDEVYTNQCFHTPRSYGGQSGSGYYAKDLQENRYVYNVVSNTTDYETGATRITQSNFEDILFEMNNWSCVLPTDEANTDFNLLIYPNPATDIIQISGDFIKPLYMVITEMSGREVSHLPFNNHLSVAGMEPGLYTLTIITESSVISQKFIIAE